MTQLRHRPGLDLTNALTGEIEVLDLFERARLAAVETEAELQDLALRSSSGASRRAISSRRSAVAAASKGGVGTAVLDHITEFGVAVLRNGSESDALGGEAKRLGDLLFRHLDLGGEFEGWPDGRTSAPGGHEPSGGEQGCRRRARAGGCGRCWRCRG